MERTSKKIVAILCAVLMFSFEMKSYAQVPTTSASAKTAGSEFYVGGDFGKPLITVHVLAGVRLPGVYHVPMDTDLAELIAYAGGATEHADLESITVRRTYPKIKLIEVDLDKEMRLAQQILPVQDKDIVRIEQKVTPERTLTWVSILASLASVVLSVYLVDDIRKR